VSIKIEEDNLSEKASTSFLAEQESSFRKLMLLKEIMRGYKMSKRLEGPSSSM
jgi:hypothetical protein